MDRIEKSEIEMEGKWKGEKGIGKGKMKYMEMEIGEEKEYMSDIKKEIDKEKIMKKGKIMIWWLK